MDYKQIKRVSEIKTENLNWIAIGKRFERYRKHARLSYSDVSKILGWSDPSIAAFESGFGLRVAVNIIWTISNAWNLSLNWLLNGIGGFCDADPVELLPETLLVEKGSGIRRTPSRIQAEEGRFTDEMLEFVTAMDKFKRFNGIGFPTWTRIYEVFLALGYRKTVPARIAPLGYVIEHQLWAEKLKQLQEIDAEIQKEEELDIQRRKDAKAEEHRKKVANAPPKYLHDPTISTKERMRRFKVGQSSKCRNIKQYIITDPEGRTYITDEGLNEFCRQHGLNANSLSAVATGRRKHHRQWTAKHVPEFAEKSK